MRCLRRMRATTLLIEDPGLLECVPTTICGARLPTQLVVHVLWVAQRCSQDSQSCSDTGRGGPLFHTTAEGSDLRGAAVNLSHPSGATPPLFHSCVLP